MVIYKRNLGVTTQRVLSRVNNPNSWCYLWAPRIMHTIAVSAAVCYIFLYNIDHGWWRYESTVQVLIGPFSATWILCALIHVCSSQHDNLTELTIGSYIVYDTARSHHFDRLLPVSTGPAMEFFLLSLTFQTHLILHL